MYNNFIENILLREVEGLTRWRFSNQQFIVWC